MVCFSNFGALWSHVPYEKPTLPDANVMDGTRSVCSLLLKIFIMGFFLSVLYSISQSIICTFRLYFGYRKRWKWRNLNYVLGILVLAYCCDITKNSTFFHKCNSGFTSIAKISYFWTFFFNSQALLKQKIVHFSPNCTFLPNLEHCT